MKKFVWGFFCLYWAVGASNCSKPKCPTYMTPQEFAKFEAERMQKGSRLKRDSKGHIKKSKKRVDKFIY